MLRKSTFTLLIILVFLALAVIFIQRAPGLNAKTDQLPTSTDSPALLYFADKSITAFTMSDDQGRVLKAKLDNQGTWFIQNPSGCQYDSGQLAYYLSLLQTFKVQVSLDIPPALADIGLSTPSYQLSLTFNDGSTQKLSVGSLVPTGTGYYVQVNNDSVVVVSNSSIDQLFNIVSTVCATPTPEPSATPEPTQTPTEAVLEASLTPAQ